MLLQQDGMYRLQMRQSHNILAQADLQLLLVENITQIADVEGNIG